MIQPGIGEEDRGRESRRITATISSTITTTTGERRNNNNRNNMKGKERDRRTRQGNNRNGRKDPGETCDDRERRHRMSGRERRAHQVKEQQMSYRRGAKACMEKVMGVKDEHCRCKLPLSNIHSKMLEGCMVTTKGPTMPTLIEDPEREKTNVLKDPFAADEVKRQMRRLPAWSAPSPDGTSYWNWKRFNPEGKLLPAVLNVCRTAWIPLSCKTSMTVLAYKNLDDKKDLDNWRLICLQNTLYKIYTATIARRIANWTLEGRVINAAQKGFLPYEGCFEHVFLLRSCLEYARRRKKRIGVVWLGLESSPLSIPKERLLGAMENLYSWE